MSRFRIIEFLRRRGITPHILHPGATYEKEIVLALRKSVAQPRSPPPRLLKSQLAAQAMIGERVLRVSQAWRPIGFALAKRPS